MRFLNDENFITALVIKHEKLSTKGVGSETFCEIILDTSSKSRVHRVATIKSIIHSWN